MDADLFKQLPNKLATFSPVIIQSLVRPFARYQHTTTRNAQMLRFVSFALAPAGCGGVPCATGLDAVEKPHGTLW